MKEVSRKSNIFLSNKTRNNVITAKMDLELGEWVNNDKTIHDEHAKFHKHTHTEMNEL